ncbi:MAG: aldo/keto reductase [Anaerolineaceae bacterium]|nr:aldo/keto reductase [Anaerolineaceae bacterium]
MTSLPAAQVGQTNLHVPILGLGTAPLGHSWTDIPEAQAHETVHFALENGVTFFDTAPGYSAYLVEERLGRALAGVPREQFVIATKAGRLVDAAGQPLLDFKRDTIRRSIEDSLTRLKLDSVDILHIHAPETEEQFRDALDEAYPLLDDMRRQGTIKAVGVGENYWEPLVKWAADAHFDCFLLAGRYTLLEQGALDALNQFQQQRISVFGAGVYNTGILAQGSTRDDVWYQYAKAPGAMLDKTRQLEAICQRHDVPLRAAAVQFVKAHPAITALVIGAESADQLSQTLDALKTSIPAAFWADLHTSGLIDANAPLPVSLDT